MPLADGSPVTRNDDHLYNFNENSMFVGVVLLVPQLLALPWLLRRRDSLFLLAAAAMVVLALQDLTPVAYVVRRIPLLRDNHLLRMTLLLQLALAAGGGIAWHVLATRPADRRHRLLIGACALLLVAAALVLAADLRTARGYGWFAASLIGSGAAALLLPWLSRPEHRAWVLCGVCVLLGLELRAAHGGYNGTLPRKIAEVPVPPLGKALREELAAGWHRIAGRDATFAPNSSAWIGIRDMRGYDLPISQRYIDFLRHAFYRGSWPYAKDLCYSACGELGISDPGQRRLVELMGVRHLFASDLAGTRSIDLPGALPHVFWAQRLRRSAGDVSHDVELLRQGDMVAELPEGHALGDGSGSLVERQVDVNTVAVEADVVQSGLLVLNEMPIRGWRVRVDGERAPVAPVNVIHTGVWLDAGRHTVEFSFRPPGSRLGWILSLCGLASALGLALAIWRSRRSAQLAGGEAGLPA
jgi:hypothetical protein